MDESQIFRTSLPKPADAPYSLGGLFEQKRWWRTGDGEWVRIRHMTEQHRHNTARMLLRNARRYAEAVYLSDTRIAANAPDEVWNSIEIESNKRESNPVGWMRSTKLFRRLSKGMVMTAGGDHLNDALRKQAKRDAIDLVGQDIIDPFGGKA